MTAADDLDVRHQRALNAEKRRHEATKRLLNDTEAALLKADNALAEARAEVERLVQRADFLSSECAEWAKQNRVDRDAIAEKIAVAIEAIRDRKWKPGDVLTKTLADVYNEVIEVAREVGRA